ncbi:hypothetical protein Q7P37_010912 [Cladosporium fusiforme]
MQLDGLSRDAARLAINSEANQDENIKIASSRLAQEARQAASFGRRGVKDITEQFSAASKDLQPGDLVIDDFFTLFEAVGALEIMDSKMDVGFVPPGEPVDTPFDPTAPLSAAQTLWILDQLSCLEVSWLEGYPLSQTVFTSLHFDRMLSPDNRYPYTLNYGQQADLSTNEACLTHIVIKAFCVCLAKCAGQALLLVAQQHHFDEEDFISHLFGRELLPRLGEEDAKTLLDDAIRWTVDSDLPQDIKTALENRLQARKMYMLSAFGEVNLWAHLVGFAEDKMTEESHSLAEPVPEAFTEKVQRHLATSTPPRPVPQLTWAEAQKKWIKLYCDIDEADRLTDSSARQNPACLQKAVWSFASRNANTYARAIFQDLIFSDGAVREDMPHFDLMLVDIRDLVLAGDSLVDPASFQVEVPSDPRHRCARIIETFMDRAYDEYLNIYRMVCQNRSRMRRMLTKSPALMHELETTIAAEADREIDSVVSQKRLDTNFGRQVKLSPLSSWSRWYKLMTMSATISLGFETDIYLDYEMGGMYWYLAQINIEKRNLLRHIETFLLDRMAQVVSSRDIRASSECLATQDWIKCLREEIEVTILLAETLSDLYALLSHVNLIKPRSRPFAEAQLVYEARMKPYLAVTDPAPPSVERFEEAETLTGSPIEAVSRIEQRIKPIKAHLANLKNTSPQAGKYVGTEAHWKAQIKQLETTSVAIFVGASLLKRTMEGSEGQSGLKEKLEASIPPPGKRYHEWWVVPQIKPKKI